MGQTKRWLEENGYFDNQGPIDEWFFELLTNGNKNKVKKKKKKQKNDTRNS